VRPATAAWLDVASASGRVRNLLDAADSPGETERAVHIRARTAHGNVVVRRA
jgi:hypothetical protein